MKKDKREALKRARREAARNRKLEKERQLEEFDSSEDDANEELLAAELAEKSDDMTAMDAVLYAAPTSFDELDALRYAREQAEHVRELTWDVQDLVRNILYSPMGAKEKARAIQDVGNGFSDRLEGMSDEPMEKGLDELELGAILAYDKRHTGIVESVADWINKKKLTSQAREKLSDDNFALVYEVDGKKVRKYPIHDKAHVRNALVGGRRGGRGCEEGDAENPCGGEEVWDRRLDGQGTLWRDDREGRQRRLALGRLGDE